MNANSDPQAVLCVANEGNEVSLQLWKVYQTLRDDDARAEGLVRVIDESGEDYLFPEENFVPIELPREAQRTFERSVRQQRRAARMPQSSGSTKRARVTGRSKTPKRRASGRASRRA